MNFKIKDALAVDQSVIPFDYVITPQMAKIIDHIREHGQITDDEVCALLDVGRTRVYSIMKKMCAMELVNVTGKGKTKKYY